MKRPLFTKICSVVMSVLVLFALLSAAKAASAKTPGPGNPPALTISGYVVDVNHQPVVGVNVIGSATINSNSVSVTNATDSTGFYSIPVTAATYWQVEVDPNTLNQNLYSTVEPITLTVIAQSRTENFVLPDFNPDGTDVQLYGYVVDQNLNPVSGIGVSATATDGASGTMNTMTDDNGVYAFIVPTASTWNVSLNCTNLNSFGYECVTEQTNVQLGFEDYIGGLNFMTQSQPFFTAEALVSTNAWFYMSTSNSPTASSLFGYYNMGAFPYVFHQDMGWEYFIDANNASHGAYFYDFADGVWFYTDPTLFPYLYDFNQGAWMWYEPSSTAGRYTSGPRWFVNLTTSVWGNHL